MMDILMSAAIVLGLIGSVISFAMLYSKSEKPDGR